MKLLINITQTLGSLYDSLVGHRNGVVPIDFSTKEMLRVCIGLITNISHLAPVSEDVIRKVVCPVLKLVGALCSAHRPSHNFKFVACEGLSLVQLERMVAVAEQCCHLSTDLSLVARVRMLCLVALDHGLRGLGISTDELSVRNVKALLVCVTFLVNEIATTLHDGYAHLEGCGDFVVILVM